MVRITVFGTGCVGLVQGAVLAEAGHEMLCIDVDAAKFERLKRGQIPIYGPGLEDLVRKYHGEGRLDFTTDAARASGFEPRILQAVEDRNDDQKEVIFRKIRAHYGGDLAGRTFALWGLSFKPNTDDMREAASRVLMEALWAAGARVQAYDPEAMEEAQRLYGDRPDLMLCGTKEACLRDADALVVMTEWQVFRAPDFDQIKARLAAPVIFDGRNLYDPARVARRGFAYYAIGRGLVEARAAAPAA